MDYQTSYDQLAAAYDPQVNQLNTQIAQLQPQQDAQQSTLDQAKVNAFRDITSGANAKGVLFSGVPIDQQAQYVGTKYLPAVANLQTSFNKTKNTLLGQINSLNSERVRTAQGNVAAYQKAQQEAADRQAQLELSYARLNSSNTNSAAARAAAANKPLNETQTVAAIRQGLTGVRGKDGYVSPQDFAAAYHDYASAGFNPSNFYKYFQGLMNPNNKYYDYAIKTYKG